MCKLTSPCPYDHQCEDCLHYALDRKGKKHQKTGIPRKTEADRNAYGREYKRRRREQQLRIEMEHAGVV